MIVKDKAYVNLSSQLAISIISIGQAVTLSYYVLKSSEIHTRKNNNTSKLTLPRFFGFLFVLKHSCMWKQTLYHTYSLR
jgi:hypothetical protein